MPETRVEVSEFVYCGLCYGDRNALGRGRQGRTLLATSLAVHSELVEPAEKTAG